MIYWLFYGLMLSGYFGLTCLAPDLKTKLIGILLILANALIFWK